MLFNAEVNEGVVGIKGGGTEGICHVRIMRGYTLEGTTEVKVRSMNKGEGSGFIRHYQYPKSSLSMAPRFEVP